MYRPLQTVFVIIVLASALILSACQPTAVPTTAANPTAAVASTTTPAPAAQATKSYSSSLYGYSLSYPAAWGIKVNTSVPAGAGKNPEFVTLYPGENMLPVITIDALTGAPPFTGYENCQANFTFRDLQACRISIPGGQIPLTELMVFKKGDAYFQISLQYDNPASLQVFDDLLTSFKFEK